MIRYIYGSENSTDTDICYILPELPSLIKCKQLAEELQEKGEDINFAVITDGVLCECYKGTPDELNNTIYYTYHLHEQSFPLFIQAPVERDIVVKDIRAIRAILSYLSRTELRKEIKAALHGGFNDRLEMLSTLDFSTIDFTQLNKKFNGESALKVIAFQIGQASGLHNGIELYTKNDIAQAFPNLSSYLHRKTLQTDLLQIELNNYIEILRSYYTTVIDYQDRTFNINGHLYYLIKETRIN